MTPGVLSARYAVKGVWAALVGLVVLAIVAFAVVQTVRLDGFRFLFFKHEGALAKVERLEGEIGAILHGQDEALERQLAVNDAAEAIYREVAGRIDDENEQAEGAALAVADRFIAANRVRCPAVGSPPGGPGATAGNHGAGDGQTPGAASELDATTGGPVGDSDLVAVPANDVRICTTNTLQAEAARKWALELEGDGGRARAPK